MTGEPAHTRSLCLQLVDVSPWPPSAPQARCKRSSTDTGAPAREARTTPAEARHRPTENRDREVSAAITGRIRPGVEDATLDTLVSFISSRKLVFLDSQYWMGHDGTTLEVSFTSVPFTYSTWLHLTVYFPQLRRLPWNSSPSFPVIPSSFIHYLLAKNCRLSSVSFISFTGTTATLLAIFTD